MKNIINITDYDTIDGKNFNEISVEEFINTLNENLESTNYNVSILDNEKNIYNITYNGIDYELNVNKKELKNSLISIILKLESLSKRETKISKNIEDETNRLNEDNRLLENAKKGIIESEHAKDLYLEYLLKSKKYTFSKVKKYISNLKNDAIASKNNTNRIFDDIPIYKISDSFIGKCVLGITSGYLFSYMLSIFTSIPGIILAPIIVMQSPFLMYIYDNIRKRVKRYKAYKQKKKLTDHKIESLSKRQFPIGQKELKKIEELEPSDNIEIIPLKVIRQAAERLKHINSIDAEKFHKELNDLLLEFDIRMENINNNKESLSLNDSEEKLKHDIILKVGDIEARMNDIEKKDKEIVQLHEETKQVKNDLKEIGETILGKAYQKRH